MQLIKFICGLLILANLMVATPVAAYPHHAANTSPACAGIDASQAFVASPPQFGNCQSSTYYGSSTIPGFIYTPGTGAASFVPSGNTLVSKPGGVDRTASSGLVVEKAETNLSLHSQDGFTTGGAYWGAFHATLANNAATAPDGTTTAGTFTLTATDGQMSNNNGGGIAQTPSTQMSLGVWASSSGALTSINARAFDGTDAAGATCVFATLVCTVNLNSYSNVSATLTQLGSSTWYQECITFTTESTSSLFTKIGIFGDGVAASGSEPFWGFQLQTGPKCGSYLTTTTATQTRNADTATVTYTQVAGDFATVYFNGQNAYIDPTSPIDLTTAGTPYYGQPMQQVYVQQGQPLPLQAKGVGYLTTTFNTPSFTTSNVDQGCAYASGKQWYNMNFFGITCPNSTGTISGGVISIVGAQVASYGFTTAGSLGGTSWVGTAFGGGFYAEAAFTYDPSAVNTADGWPSWWSMAIDHLAGLSSQQWPGQVAGYTSYSEFDFFEADGAAGLGQSSIHHWYGTGTCSGSSNCIYSNNAFATYLTPSSTQIHYWGALWVPATGSTNGYVQMYLDGVKFGSQVSWSQYVGASDTPPPSGSTPWAFGVIDVNHMVLFLSSATNTPINAHEVTVWQTNGSNNIIH